MQFSIGFESSSLEAKAEELASRLNLSIDNHAPFCLWVSDRGLGFKMGKAKPIFANFSLDFWKKRRDEGKKLGLVRAVKPIQGMRVIDACAGWGRDAAILASLGAEVLMLERNPLIAAVVADALARQDEKSKAGLKLSVQLIDSITYLNQISPDEFPEVIYIDPMHPTRQKSALVKKDLQILQHLVGEDKDAKSLLALALTKVRQKVVVKWPQKSPPLIPTHACIEGKTIRFDLYAREFQQNQ